MADLCVRKIDIKSISREMADRGED